MKLPEKSALLQMLGKKNNLRPFCIQEKGSFAMMFALMAVPIMGFTGLAVDMGRGYLLREKLNMAVDAASLAGARLYYTDRRTSETTNYYYANIKDGYMGAKINAPVITNNDTAGTLKVEASATLPTYFMQFIGKDTLDVKVSSTAQRADKGMELVMVLDNTGSMKGQKITDMRTAATSLVNIVYGSRETIDNFWIGIVPYTTMVNIGTSRQSWLISNPFAGLTYSGYEPTTKRNWSTSWKGCVEARYGAASDRDDLTDAPPSLQGYKPYYWVSAANNLYPSTNSKSLVLDETVNTNTTSNNGYGPNLGCGPEMMSLQASKTKALNKVAEMNSWHRGGTMSNVGLNWGWNMLSQRWRGLWGGDTPATLPLNYNTEKMSKVIVLMTDGQNDMYNGASGTASGDTDYSSYGRLKQGNLKNSQGQSITVKSTAITELNNRTTKLCNSIKANGIEIYAILFQVPNDSGGTTIKNLFKSCASSPGNYFDAGTGYDLDQAFRAIGSQLSNLRLIRE